MQLLEEIAAYEDMKIRFCSRYGDQYAEPVEFLENYSGAAAEQEADDGRKEQKKCQSEHRCCNRDSLIYLDGNIRKAAGEEIRRMNEADLYNLTDILAMSERELGIGIGSRNSFK